LEYGVSGSHWTDIVWVDLLGRPRAVRVPSETVVTGLPFEVPKRHVLAGYDNKGRASGVVRLIPDVSTQRDVAWDANRSIVIADLQEEDGSPSPLCGRSTLRRVVKAAEELGYGVHAAAELEFFILTPETGQPIYSDIQQYSIIKGTELEPLLKTVRNDLRRMGIPIEASNPEYAGGQVEVNIAYGPALEAADRAMLMRSLIRVLARRVGLNVTFMAKPWTDQAGNGMHLHQSLWREGRNAFSEDAGLSSIATRYAAGLLSRIQEYSLFGSPTPNAYHRRSDYTFAPTRASWGADNRTLAVRAVADHPNSTRLEQRDAAADCNIYLALAGQISAGLEGVSQGLEPPAQVVGDSYSREDLPTLPRTFLEAYDQLATSAAAKSCIGQETVASYLEILGREREVLLHTAADWERARYLSSV
jgi:glutamine synthetase